MKKRSFEFQEYDGNRIRILDGRIADKSANIDGKSNCTFDALNTTGIVDLSSAKICINPERIKASDLLEILEHDIARSQSGEAFNFRKDYPDSYCNDLKWSFDADHNSACITLILVAYQEERIVGFLNLGISLLVSDSTDVSESVCLSYLVEPRLVYVLQNERQKGFGYDLTVACSDIACDIICAIHASAQDGSTLSATLLSEYQSIEGQKISEHIEHNLRNLFDNLSESGDRDNLILTELELDGGW